MATENDNTTLRKALSQDLMEVLVRFSLIAFLVVTCLQIFAPFAGLMLWGLILAVALYPLHRRIAARLGDHQGGAATVLVLALLFLIGWPTIMLGGLFVESIHDGYEAFSSGSVSIAAPSPSVAEWPIIGEKGDVERRTDGQARLSHLPIARQPAGVRHGATGRHLPVEHIGELPQLVEVGRRAHAHPPRHDDASALQAAGVLPHRARDDADRLVRRIELGVRLDNLALAIGVRLCREGSRLLGLSPSAASARNSRWSPGCWHRTPGGWPAADPSTRHRRARCGGRCRARCNRR